MTLPGQGKSYETFQTDDQRCRAYAQAALGQDNSVANGAQSAVLASAVGAAAGALIAGGRGAAIGAGSGLLIGSAAGSGTARLSRFAAQDNYDRVYIQCMYGKGHLVPLERRRHSAYD